MKILKQIFEYAKKIFKVINWKCVMRFLWFFITIYISINVNMTIVDKPIIINNTFISVSHKIG